MSSPENYAAPSGPAPIADRSYRNYEGPLRAHTFRWWVVAILNLRSTLRKPGFWILSLIGTIPYISTGFNFTITNMIPAGGSVESPYAAQFYGAMQSQEFWIFLSALVVGTNIIATDMRANALLIYLSKPINKGDYLFGKWMGVFLPLYCITVAPAIVFYLCCVLGLFGAGFLKSEPTLFWRVPLAAAIPAMVHASLLVGFSAWSKSGRIAGAAYAGFYLISGMIFTIIGGIEMRSHAVSTVLLQHLSVSGVVSGLVQCIYHVKPPINFFQRQFATGELPTAAFTWEMVGLFVLLNVLGIALARVKINAVEVVRG